MIRRMSSAFARKLEKLLVHPRQSVNASNAWYIRITRLPMLDTCTTRCPSRPQITSYKTRPQGYIQTLTSPYPSAHYFYACTTDRDHTEKAPAEHSSLQLSPTSWLNQCPITLSTSRHLHNAAALLSCSRSSAQHTPNMSSTNIPIRPHRTLVA